MRIVWALMALSLLSGCIGGASPPPGGPCISFNRDWYGRGFTQVAPCDMHYIRCKRECEAQAGSGRDLSEGACLFDGSGAANIADRNWACEVRGKICAGNAKNKVTLNEDCEGVHVDYDMDDIALDHLCHLVGTRSNAEACMGREVAAKGRIICQPKRGGLPLLRFGDGSSISLIGEIAACPKDDMLRYIVVGRLRQCMPADRCTGDALADIKEVQRS